MRIVSAPPGGSGSSAGPKKCHAACRTSPRSRSPARAARSPQHAASRELERESVVFAERARDEQTESLSDGSGNGVSGGRPVRPRTYRARPVTGVGGTHSGTCRKSVVGTPSESRSTTSSPSASPQPRSPRSESRFWRASVQPSVFAVSATSTPAVKTTSGRARTAAVQAATRHAPGAGATPRRRATTSAPASRRNGSAIASVWEREPVLDPGRPVDRPQVERVPAVARRPRPGGRQRRRAEHDERLDAPAVPPPRAAGPSPRRPRPPRARAAPRTGTDAGSASRSGGSASAPARQPASR